MILIRTVNPECISCCNFFDRHKFGQVGEQWGVDWVRLPFLDLTCPSLTGKVDYRMPLPSIYEKNWDLTATLKKDFSWRTELKNNIWFWWSLAFVPSFTAKLTEVPQGHDSSRVSSLVNSSIAIWSPNSCNFQSHILTIKPRGLLQNMPQNAPDVHWEKSFYDPASLKSPQDFLVIKCSWRPLLQYKHINLNVMSISPHDSVIRFSYEVTS